MNVSLGFLALQDVTGCYRRCNISPVDEFLSLALHYGGTILPVSVALGLFTDTDAFERKMTFLYYWSSVLHFSFQFKTCLLPCAAYTELFAIVLRAEPLPTSGFEIARAQAYYVKSRGDRRLTSLRQVCRQDKEPHTHAKAIASKLRPCQKVNVTFQMGFSSSSSGGRGVTVGQFPSFSS